MSIWHDIRAREFSRLRTTYLNAAYRGPSPARALEAARRALEEEADPSDLVYEEWRERPERVRALAARLVGATADEVAVVTSTTEIVNRIAQGLRLGAGDRVAVIEGDYPAIVLPWLARERDGVRVDRLVPPERPPSPAWLGAALAPGTRVLALSWVTFDTGARADVEAIASVCAARGIHLVVDATQAIGAIEVDLARLPGVSALSVSSYKWLCGPYGMAFAVVRPGLQAALEQRWVNWLATRNSRRADDLLRYTLEMLPGARGLDRGQTPALVPIAMLAASLDLLVEIGPAAVAARACGLADRLVAGLDRDRYALATPERARAAIVSLLARDPVDRETLPARLAAAGIRASVREGKLRVSPHFYNNEAEVDRLLEVLATRV